MIRALKFTRRDSATDLSFYYSLLHPPYHNLFTFETIQNNYNLLKRSIFVQKH